MTRTIEFKPSVTVRLEILDGGETKMFCNGEPIYTFRPTERPTSRDERNIPGLTAAIEELRKPLAEDEAWLDGERFAVSLRADGYIWLDRSWVSLEGIREQARLHPDPEGWPRVLAIAERLLAEREPKIEAWWDGECSYISFDGKEFHGEYNKETCTHNELNRQHPGAWEKHVLPCILANRSLAENEFRVDGGIVEMEWRPDNGGQVRIKRTTCGQDDWSVWHYDHPLVRPEIVAYLRKKNAEHAATKPKKPSKRLIEIFKSRGYDKRAPGNEVQDVLSAVGEMLDEEFERRGGGA